MTSADCRQFLTTAAAVAAATHFGAALTKGCAEK